MISTKVFVFWTLVTLMTIVAMLVLALPWIRPRPRSAVGRENLNLTVYRDRLDELDMALDYPSLTFEQREQERHRLTRELLNDLGSSAEVSSATPASGRRALFAVITLLPILAFVLYTFLGTGTQLFSPATALDASADSKRMPSIEQMLSKLIARLETHPNDLQGWIMLARSYVALEHYPEAIEAYGRAMALEGDKSNPEITVDYAEALVLANGNRITDQARSLLNKLLQEVPNHPKGLWLAGVWAFQEERYQAAIEFWQRFKSLLPAGSELIEKIDVAIAEAERKAIPPPSTKE